MPFRTPVEEYDFILKNIIGFHQVSGTERFADATDDVVKAILTEAGKLCEDVMAPVNRNGDLYPAVLENGVVRTSSGFSDAFAAIADGGWLGMSGDPDYGGMGFVEETGAAQYARDMRVTTIYEGTNGIQAMDLVARKMKDERRWRDRSPPHR